MEIPIESAAEDIDTNSAGYAEIKMLATRKSAYQRERWTGYSGAEIALAKSNYLSENALEDKILKFYPQEIATLKETIAGLKTNNKTRLDHPKSTDDHFH